MNISDSDLKGLADRLNGFDAILLPCSSKKWDGGAGRADEVYCGAYFKKQLALASKLGGKVYILSTKYGIIEPSDIIEPYNLLWSKKLQDDNRRMRGKKIPLATEAHRLEVSIKVERLLAHTLVLSFCSLHYRPYLPDFAYFNDVAGEYATDSSRKGIQFLNKCMHELIRIL